MVIDTRNEKQTCADLSTTEILEKLTLLEDFAEYGVEGADWTYLKSLADDAHDVLTEISNRF
jgi:hypothetical protein